MNRETAVVDRCQNTSTRGNSVLHCTLPNMHEGLCNFESDMEMTANICQRIANKLIRRAEYNERSFGANAMLAEELRRLAKEILDDV